MLFREREPVGPQSIGRGVGEALTRLSAHIGVLPAERRAGFEQVVAQARAAMADQHVEFAQALTSVLEVAVGEAQDELRRRVLTLRR